VVLALLALLVLIAATFSISVRMELVASQNYAQTIAAENSARVALNEALGYVEGATSVTNFLQPWARARVVTKDGRKVTSPSSKQTRGDTPIARPYDLSIADLSARLNLNAVEDAASFARFLEVIMPQEMAGGMASVRAEAFLRWRGELKETPTTAGLDTRFAPPAGLRRVEHMEQLLANADHPNLFTEAELAKLAPYTTVFSMASESQNVGLAADQEKVPLENLTVDKAYVALRNAFPEKDDRLLRQYAANLVDLLDDDGVPTRLSDPKHPEPWNDLLGLELTPFITEVYPDSLTRGTDEGQFVEIYNPWSEAISVDGWRLVVGGDGGRYMGHAMIPLNGKIAPGGFLIITDCYDTPAPNTEPGTGSFLAIFGRRADEQVRRVIQNAALDLPDKNSVVTLVDARGNVIDIFSYTASARENSRESYQRPDPTVRAFLVGEATPFELYAPEKTREVRDHLTRVKNLWQGVRATHTVGLGQLLLIPTSYVGLSSNGKSTRLDPHLAQTCELELPSEAPGRARMRTQQTNLDLRVLDVFATSNSVRGSGSYPDSSLLRSYGKLNVNTCAPETLWGLDGRSGNVDLINANFVALFTAYRQARYQAGQVPFARMSDFAQLALQGYAMDSQVAEALSKLLSQVCVGSLAFEVWAKSPASQVSTTKMVSGPVVKAHWILGLDFHPCSVIHFAENSW
jgi:hypothetical protein